MISNRWQKPAEDRRDVRLRKDNLREKAAANRHDERHHQRFDVAKSFVLQIHHRQHVERGNADAPHERNAKEQIQGNRRPDDFGEVARTDGQLTQNPQAEGDWSGIVISTGLRQIASRHDAKLRAQ